MTIINGTTTKNITVSGNGKNINGSATLLLLFDESVTLKYNGTQWRIV